MSETLIPQLRDPETLQALTESVREVFEQWGIHEANAAALLDLPNVGLLRDNTPLPADEGVLERVGHLMAIHRKLNHMYPDQPERWQRWITTSWAGLGDRSPLQLMLGGELEGIRRVRDFIESQQKETFPLV